MAVRVDWNLASSWADYYGAGSSAGRVGYGRVWATDDGRVPLDSGDLARRADALEARGIGTTDRIIVVGCGFGFLIEVLAGRGYTNTFGIDSSSDIESKKGVEASGDIVLVSEEMNGTGRVKAVLRQQTGDDEFDWIVTESVMESYDDSDVQVICNVCEGGLYNTHTFANIIHMVFEPPWPKFPGVFNEKTLAEWKAMRPAHTWVSLDTFEVL